MPGSLRSTKMCRIFIENLIHTIVKVLKVPMKSLRLGVGVVGNQEEDRKTNK